MPLPSHVSVAVVAEAVVTSAAQFMEARVTVCSMPLARAELKLMERKWQWGGQKWWWQRGKAGWGWGEAEAAEDGVRTRVRFGAIAAASFPTPLLVLK